MTTTVTFDETDIIQAVKEYLTSRGFDVKLDTFKYENKRITVEVEKAKPTGSSFRDR